VKDIKKYRGKISEIVWRIWTKGNLNSDNIWTSMEESQVE
jgi:hypothetical protein